MALMTAAKPLNNRLTFPVHVWTAPREPPRVSRVDPATEPEGEPPWKARLPGWSASRSPSSSSSTC